MQIQSRRHCATVLLATAVGLLGGCAAANRNTLLDGDEKSFVIVGYSTSYAWPAMLQDMLDEHAGGRRIYHVLNAVVGGSPVEYWVPESDRFNRTFGAMLRDFFGTDARLRGDAPEPKIALCQQSLQFTRTRRGPIASADDEQGIRIGADAMERMAEALHERGLERVYIGMHIYKEPVEPEVGNERLALAELLRRGHPYLYEGPDVWTPTRDGFPGVFDDDGVHPNERGMKIMCEGWYRTIAGDEARPEIIAGLHARKYDVVPMMRDYVEWRREPRSASDP